MVKFRMYFINSTVKCDILGNTQEHNSTLMSVR